MKLLDNQSLLASGVGVEEMVKTVTDSHWYAVRYPPSHRDGWENLRYMPWCFGRLKDGDTQEERLWLEPCLSGGSSKKRERTMMVTVSTP